MSLPYNEAGSIREKALIQESRFITGSEEELWWEYYLVSANAIISNKVLRYNSIVNSKNSNFKNTEGKAQKGWGICY